MSMIFHLVLKLRDNIQVFADKRNWVLQVNDTNNRSYYHTLDELCDDLLEIRLTKKLSKKECRDISSITKSVRDVREEIRNDLECLESVMTNADTARKKGVFSK